MKPFNLASLVLIFLISGCSIFCDSSIKNIFIGQANFHNIQKRQVGINSDISRQYHLITTRQECTSGYIQARLNQLFQCNQTTEELFTNLKVGCHRNSMGDYCLGVLPYILKDTYAIMLACPISMNSCFTECKRRLMKIRNELGCCIYVINETLMVTVYRPAFQYSLWSSCGLERITNNCTSILKPPPVPVDPCDTKQDLNISCQRRYIQPIVDALSLEGTCQLSTRNILSKCEVNEFGQYCSDIAPQFRTNYSEVHDNCSNTSVCEPLCRSALENLKVSAGCCIDVLYNRSSLPPFLSYKFWLLCGLDTPGICQSRLTGPTAPTPSTSSVTINIGISVSIVTVLIILGISAGTIIYCIITKRKKSKANVTE